MHGCMYVHMYVGKSVGLCVCLSVCLSCVYRNRENPWLNAWAVLLQTSFGKDTKEAEGPSRHESSGIRVLFDRVAAMALQWRFRVTMRSRHRSPHPDNNPFKPPAALQSPRT